MMNANEQLIHDFYAAFQNKDYAAMQRLYTDKAQFNDEVFQNLNGNQAGKMWEMLIKKGQDLQLTFENVHADDHKGTADWTAMYTFSKTGRVVVNHIQASFVFEDGKIVRHTDKFNFRRWAKQAFGPLAAIPVFNIILKRKVRKTAKSNLSEFMRQAESGG